jgi:hypothetical protein
MSASYGMTYWLRWQDCDLDGWSLKTRQGLLPGFLPSSVALPASGTWDLMGYFPQPPLEPPTDETGSSSSRLLPTPVAQGTSTGAAAFLWRKSRDGSQRKVVTALAVVVRDLLPTPTAADSKSSAGQKDRRDHTKAGTTLTEAARAMALLPTPTAGDGQGGGKRPTTIKQLTQATGAGGASRLRDIALVLLPTPRARDGTSGTGGRDTVRRRMGRDQGPALPGALDWIGLSDCQTAAFGTTGQPSVDMRLF